MDDFLVVRLHAMERMLSEHLCQDVSVRDISVPESDHVGLIINYCGQELTFFFFGASNPYSCTNEVLRQLRRA